jgi:hypothetical protein
MIVPMSLPFAVVPGFALGLVDSAALSGPVWPARRVEAGVTHLAPALIIEGHRPTSPLAGRVARCNPACPRILTACLSDCITSSLTLTTCRGWPGSGRKLSAGRFSPSVSNPIESTLATVRLSTRVAKGPWLPRRRAGDGVHADRGLQRTLALRQRPRTWSPWSGRARNFEKDTLIERPEEAGMKDAA